MDILEGSDQGQRISQEALDDVLAAHARHGRRLPAHVIVVGNEKGGSGKSTTAMHLIVALLRAGATVGSLDLDARQGTLTRYIDNRATYAKQAEVDLPLPIHRAVPIADDDPHLAEAFATALADLSARCDIIVIDTPGIDSQLSRLGHSFADTLVTPLNDSFVDLDVLAQSIPDTGRPPLGHYAAMVFDQRKRRAARDGGSIDWVVMRNRLSSLDARNKREIADALEDLARRIGFRLAPGFGERVVFRELFPRGLTLLDLRELTPADGLTMSHVAARQEVRTLLEAIGLGALAPSTETPRENG